MGRLEKSDPMNMFAGKSKKFGSVIREANIKAKKESSEHFEQLVFCKWLKHTYPDILFRSDIQNQGKRSPQMQNIMQIVDPYREGMPDVWVYLPHPHYKYIGLVIDLKKIGASIDTPHGRVQQAAHERLRGLGFWTEFAWGAEDAKRVFLEYIRA